MWVVAARTYHNASKLRSQTNAQKLLPNLIRPRNLRIHRARNTRWPSAEGLIEVCPRAERAGNVLAERLNRRRQRQEVVGDGILRLAIRDSEAVRDSIVKIHRNQLARHRVNWRQAHGVNLEDRGRRATVRQDGRRDHCDKTEKADHCYTGDYSCGGVKFFQGLSLRRESTQNARLPSRQMAHD